MTDMDENMNENKCVSFPLFLNFFSLLSSLLRHPPLSSSPSALRLNSLLDQPAVGICGLIRLPG